MARSEDEGVVLWLQIIGLVKVASRRSSTSRRLPLRTSSDLQLRFGFVPAARATAAFDTDYSATLARLFENQFYCLFVNLICVFWAGDGFAWSRYRRFQNVRLKLGRKIRQKMGQLRLRDSRILADLLQRVWIRIRLAQSLQYSRLR